MSSLSLNHLHILNDPLLTDHWMIFHFPSMHKCFNEYFDKEKLDEICDASLPLEEAVKKLHLYVLESDNDDFYSIILNYCQEKYTCLFDLLTTLWIDMDQVEENHVNGSTKLTKNQYKNLLNRHSELVEKFNLCLNDKLIGCLLREYSPEDESLPPTGESLFETLTWKKRRQFYNKVCQLLQEQRDKYKDCVDFMSNAHRHDDDDDEAEDQEIHESVHISSHELTLIKSQLGDMKCAVGGLVREYIDEMCEWKQEMSNTVCVLESNLNEQFGTLETRIQQLMMNLQVENKQLRNELARQEEKKVNEMNALKADYQEQIQMIRDELTKQAEEIKKFSPPFPLKPSLEMKEIKKSYKHAISGLSPMIADQWGVYPTVNWKTIGGSHDWTSQWTKILQQKSYNYMNTPPLLLPVELGGWCVQLNITWNNQLILYGFIINDHPFYSNAPQELNVHFECCLQMEGFAPFVIDKSITFKRAGLLKWEDVQCKISQTVDRKWPLPTMTIKVKL